MHRSAHPSARLGAAHRWGNHNHQPECVSIRALQDYHASELRPLPARPDYGFGCWFVEPFPAPPPVKLNVKTSVIVENDGITDSRT